MDNEIAGTAKCFPSAKLHDNGDKWNSDGDKDEESERLTPERFQTGREGGGPARVTRDINVSYISLIHAVL